MPYNHVLHVSVHQNHYRASILQKFKNIITYATCNFFVSEISLIYKVPDNDFGESKHEVHCCMILKRCVVIISFAFQHSKCDGLNQYKKVHLVCECWCCSHVITLLTYGAMVPLHSNSQDHYICAFLC